jgi:hypothetical protein
MARHDRGPNCAVIAEQGEGWRVSVSAPSTSRNALPARLATLKLEPITDVESARGIRCNLVVEADCGRNGAMRGVRMFFLELKERPPLFELLQHRSPRWIMW